MSAVTGGGRLILASDWSPAPDTGLWLVRRVHVQVARGHGDTISGAVTVRDNSIHCKLLLTSFRRPVLVDIISGSWNSPLAQKINQSGFPRYFSQCNQRHNNTNLRFFKVQSSVQSRIYFNLWAPMITWWPQVVMFHGWPSSPGFPIKITMLITPYIRISPVTTISANTHSLINTEGDQKYENKHLTNGIVHLWDMFCVSHDIINCWYSGLSAESVI